LAPYVCGAAAAYLVYTLGGADTDVHTGSLNEDPRTFDPRRDGMWLLVVVVVVAAVVVFAGAHVLVRHMLTCVRVLPFTESCMRMRSTVP
jgi:hypothetical protein